MLYIFLKPDQREARRQLFSAPSSRAASRRRAELNVHQPQPPQSQKAHLPLMLRRHRPGAILRQRQSAGRARACPHRLGARRSKDQRHLHMEQERASSHARDLLRDPLR